MTCRNIFYPIASLPASQLLAEVSPTSTFEMAIVRSVESSIPGLMEERIFAILFSTTQEEGVDHAFDRCCGHGHVGFHRLRDFASSFGDR